MTDVTIITTTINVPHVLRLYDEHVPEGVNLSIIVAGDTKTPAHETMALLDALDCETQYLGTSGYVEEHWRNTHEAVGFRSIQRRNLALLEAIAWGADVIITIDDDNIPHEPSTFIAEILEQLEKPVSDVLVSDTGWYNPGLECVPQVTHRGFPVKQRHVEPMYERLGVDPKLHRVGVVAGLWTGDPDIDAMERIVNAPVVTGVSPDAQADGVVPALETWAPFNTQNTAYVRELAPLMMCIPHVGRYDDIWMSYIARRIMDHLGYVVRYGRPLVRQDRNDHDLTVDLENEVHGMKHTTEFTEALRAAPLKGDDIVDLLSECYRAVYDYLPPAAIKACGAWLVDVEQAMKEAQA